MAEEEEKKRNPGLNEFQKAQRAADGKKAMQEYISEGAAMRAKTERLRALRLAHEQAERDNPTPPPAPAAKAVKGKAAAKPVAKGAVKPAAKTQAKAPAKSAAKPAAKKKASGKK